MSAPIAQPREDAAAAHGARWRGCRCSSRLTASARSSPAATPPRPGRPSFCRRPARRSMSMPASLARRCWSSRPIRRAAQLRSIAAPGRPTICAAPRSPIGAFEDDAEADAFAAAARAAGVPVNVIDKPAFCDFSFGAIVNRSPLVIGISTDGAAPVFAQAIRAKLEALLPQGFARWAAAAARWRARGEGVRPVVRRPPQILAAVHRARGGASRQRAGRGDFERLLAEVKGLAPRVEHGSVDAGRRRPGRSGAADAARGARAAIRRRHPVRRSRVARRARLRPPRGAARCWSARPAMARPASRTTSTR